MREEVNEATSQQVNEFFCLTSRTGRTSPMGNESKIRNLEDSRGFEGGGGACGHLSVRRLSISGKVVPRNEKLIRRFMSIFLKSG